MYRDLTIGEDAITYWEQTDAISHHDWTGQSNPGGAVVKNLYQWVTYGCIRISYYKEKLGDLI